MNLVVITYMFDYEPTVNRYYIENSYSNRVYFIKWLLEDEVDLVTKLINTMD